MKRGRNNQTDSDERLSKKSKGKPGKANATSEVPVSTGACLSIKDAHPKAFKVAVDEACPAKDTAKVFVDDKAVSFDASLSLSNIDGNNNKYYYIQLLVFADRPAQYAVWTHWGRVGEHGQNKLDQGLDLEGARCSFMKKFKDKTGLSWEKRQDTPKSQKYTLIEKSYEEDSDSESRFDDGELPLKSEDDTHASSTLSNELQQLVRFLFDTGNMKISMAAQNYNYNKLPLGKLSRGTIEKGYLALKELGDVILNPKLAQDKYGSSSAVVLTDLTSKYYTIIPHDFGRSRPPPINTEIKLKMEMDLVETLGNMQISDKIIKETENTKDLDGHAVHVLDAQFSSLGLQETTPLEKTSAEFDHLQKYFNHSNEAHSVISDATIENIYRITRGEEVKRFMASGYDATGMEASPVRDHRRLLWHGSRGCNFGGILTQGLRIAPPEAPANGKAFGNGIYLADRSSKSAAYCDPWTSNQTSLILLCETQLGDPSYIKTSHEYTAAQSMRQKGLISTKMMENGKNEPLEWIDAVVVNEDLENAKMPNHKIELPEARGNPNEYIVYDVAQLKIRYVFMLKWKGARRWGIY